MKRQVIMTAFAAAAAIGIGTPSLAAATTATATSDLNIRSGPGPQYSPTGVVPNGKSVEVDGCIKGSQWCRVNYHGKSGWSYAQYLTMDYQGQTVVIQQRPSAVPVVTYQAPANAPVPARPVQGELIGRVGDVPPPAIQAPPSNVRTYVVDHRMQPTYLNGEVVVGAGVPDTVQLQQVPDYSYDYTYVNGEPVLVDPGSRRIVYVYR